MSSKLRCRGVSPGTSLNYLQQLMNANVMEEEGKGEWNKRQLETFTAPTTPERERHGEELRGEEG